MLGRFVRTAALVVLGILMMSASCSGKRPMWFRVTCAVAGPGGAQEGMSVSFRANKVEQSGKIPYDPYYEWTAATLATGWTPEHICQIDLQYDSRSTEFVEDVRVIATLNDEGDIYSDTATYTPVIFLNDTQAVTLRIDLPTK